MIAAVKKSKGYHTFIKESKLVSPVTGKPDSVRKPMRYTEGKQAHSVLPETSLNLIRRTTDKPNLKNILQNNWPIFVNNVNIIKDKKAEIKED